MSYDDDVKDVKRFALKFGLFAIGINIVVWGAIIFMVALAIKWVF